MEDAGKADKEYALYSTHTPPILTVCCRTAELSAKSNVKCLDSCTYTSGGYLSASVGGVHRFAFDLSTVLHYCTDKLFEGTQSTVLVHYDPISLTMTYLYARLSISIVFDRG